MLIKDMNGRSEAKGLPVIRTITGGRIQVIICSDSWVFAEVHWLGRQIVCAGALCEACAVNRARIRGYALARVSTPNGERLGLLELAAGTIDQFAGMLALEGAESMRGVVADLTKRTKKSPARLEPTGHRIDTKGEAHQRSRTIEAFAVLHKLPIPLQGESEEQWSERAARAAALQIAGAT